MPKKIVILEDNADRKNAMLSCLQDRFYSFQFVFFDRPAEMCRFCESNLDDVIVISLDHDIELDVDANGRCIDHGTGQEVASLLASKNPICPVVIHTSNSRAGDGMEQVLQEAGWKTLRVVPYEDLKWISEAWFRIIRSAIVSQATAETATQH